MSGTTAIAIFTVLAFLMAVLGVGLIIFTVCEHKAQWCEHLRRKALGHTPIGISELCVPYYDPEEQYVVRKSGAPRNIAEESNKIT